MLSRRLHYPWFSTLGSLVLVLYLFIYTREDLVLYYQLPEIIFDEIIALLMIVSVFLCVLFDVRIFYWRSKKYDEKMLSLNDQVSELLIVKKKLQNKAHTFSGHADKLKLFISDRLLEYIEYDEKFLHFKSIAAEVRHTGVICFDKVQTALTQAISETKRNGGEYQDALNSMIYLWDLLELSTTDNLALHISNQLCECEEHYYQAMLKDDDLINKLAPPTFSPRNSVVNSLDSFMVSPIKIESDKSDEVLKKQDDLFWINLAPTQELLGNANHVVLLMENLINNAVFFSGKKPFGHKYSKVGVQLFNRRDKVRFSIYNHGPHISDVDKDQLFQLGYSTRKAKEYNGKGLGLYFVDQIVKGYEGKISFSNIYNNEEIYSIRIAFADGSLVTELVETRRYGNKIKCKRSNDDKFLNKAEWSSKELVVSVEVSMQANQNTYSFTDIEKQHTTFLDPEDTSMPRWAIEVVQRKRSAKVMFLPLDVNGVRFVVDLPSAASRLDYSDDMEEYNDIDDAELAVLREDFIELDQ